MDKEEMKKQLHFHHFGVEVIDILDSINLLECIGAEQISDIIHDQYDDVILVMVEIGDVKVELIKFQYKDINGMKERRQGVHHTCFEVENFEEFIRDVKTAGLRQFKDTRPAPLFEGKKICWFFMKELGVIEIKEK